MTITIKHTRQHGTLVYGTRQGDGAGKVLFAQGFRPSEWLPDDEELGDAWWYMPHSRRSSAKKHNIKLAKEALTALGFEVIVDSDNCTPAIGFDDLEQERYDRADARSAANSRRAGRALAESESIRASNDRTYDMLNGTPILIGHHSEGRHRRLLDRLWKREGKAWELYDRAKDWHNKAEAAEHFRHRREAVGTTRRRIDKHEARLRKIGRELDGRREVLWDNPDGWPGPAEKRISDLRERGVPVTVLKRDGEHVLVHIGVSDHTKAIYAAEVVELTEELAYWEAVLEASGKKIWTKDDFQPGDFASAGGNSWFEVVKVNARTLSLAGLYDGRIRDVSTKAEADMRSRTAAAFRTLPYDSVTGKLSGEEVRRRFPNVFAESLDANSTQPPPRPAKKRGPHGLKDNSGAWGHYWTFEVDHQAYIAKWSEPDGWHDFGSILKPCDGDLPTIRVSKRGKGFAADEATEHELKLKGPIWYLEDVHNQVVVFLTKTFPPKPQAKRK